MLGGELENETSQHFCGIIWILQIEFWNPPDGTRKYSLNKIGAVGGDNKSGWWETRLTRTEVCFPRLSLKAFKFQTSHGPQEHDIVKCQIDARESPSNVVD